MLAKKKYFPALFYFLLASLMVGKIFLGQTYYPGDILYSHPLWYDGQHSTSNYDLIDPIALYYSHDLLYNEELKQGRLITWNPYSFCGHPIYADGKSGMLYPPRLLLHFLLSPTLAHDLLLWLHLGFAGCAMHVFLKRLKIEEKACLLGASVWMLNGLQATWLESEYVTIFGVWLPIAMERLLVGLKGPKISPLPLLTATLSLGLLGLCGLVQFWAHSLLLCGFWVLYLSWRSRSWRHVLAGGTALFAVLPLVAVQVLPMFELVGRSQRLVRELSHQIDCFQNLILSTPALMLNPDSLGNPSRGLAFKFISTNGDWITLETCSYLGVAALFMLLFSAAAKQKPYWPFFAASTLTLIIVPMTPLYWLAFKFLPGFSQTISTRLIFLLVFLFSILVAYGAHAFLEASPRQRKGLLWSVFGLTMLWWLALASLHLQQKSHPAQWSTEASKLLEEGRVRFPFRESFPSDEDLEREVQARFSAYYSASNPIWYITGFFLTASLFLLWVARPQRALLAIIALNVVDLLLFSWQFNSTTTAKFLSTPPEAVRFLQGQAGHHRVMGLGTIRPNTTNPFRLLTVEGHNSIIPSPNLKFLNALQNGDPRLTQGPFTTHAFPIKNPTSALVDVAGARFVVSYPGQNLEGLGYQAVFQQSNGVVVWENPKAYPLVWLASNFERVESFEEALEKLFQADRDSRVPVIESEEALELEEQSVQPVGEVKVREFRPGYWHLETEGPGWLILGEAHDPGWSATVDGHPTEIKKAQALFQALELGAGTHSVIFRYRPPRLRIGAGMSLVTLGGLLCLGLVLLLRGKNSDD